MFEGGAPNYKTSKSPRSPLNGGFFGEGTLVRAYRRPHPQPVAKKLQV